MGIQFILLDSISETCTFDSDCETRGTICFGGKCACEAGYLRSGDRCTVPTPPEPSISPNIDQGNGVIGICKSNADCSGGNTCSDGKCQCPSGYIKDGDKCVKNGIFYN